MSNTSTWVRVYPDNTTAVVCDEHGVIVSGLTDHRNAFKVAAAHELAQHKETS